MKIEEKDFKIDFDSTQFTLLLFKSKKELKEDSKETFKTAGYFKDVYNALKMAQKWREDKKYPFKESASDLKLLLKDYRKITNKLKEVSLNIYNPVFEFKKQVINGSR